HQLEPTPAQRHRQRAYYLANVTMIDGKIGEILQTLDDRGYLDNAVVIFTSDHGDALGDHGHSQKWTMYDQITRVPTVVWSPNRFEGGRTVDALVQQMDLGPTILELAGATPPETLEAQSMLPALTGGEFPGREHLFAEQAGDHILTHCKFMTMVRSRDWKLVHFLDEPQGQLFDLTRDPQELINLWDESPYIEKKRELLGVLREWRIRSGFETAAWCADWR
ncbi:MAG: sulfatase-like hydrolase/transferase, partial [Planctomycetales bacterium]|nr:sulfatase-like hydrolase/transferase [Planctomycetales bacterium]